MKKRRSHPILHSQNKKPSNKIDFGVGGSDSEDNESNNNNNNHVKRRKRRDDEEVSSDEGDDDNDYMSNDEDSDNEEERMEETLEAKKIRLARDYLSQVSSKVRGEGGDSSSSSDDDDDSDEDAVGRRLARERLKRAGALERAIAVKVQTSLGHMYPTMDEDISTQQQQHIQLCRGHDLTPTCVSLHKSGDVAYSASKDGSVLSWDVETARKKHVILDLWKKGSMALPRTKAEVLAVANSDDGRYLAVGGRENTVKIFDVRLLGKNNNTSCIKTFDGHRGAVTCLAFRTHSLELFSGSEDRCIRHYNLEQMAYTETLYGHQGSITSLACHLLPRPLSTARDRTLRAWKIDEESHLIYRGGSKATSCDCVAVVKDDKCLTGHDDGHVSLWSLDKKKPVAVLETDASYSPSSAGTGVVCVDALKGSDLAVTGSNDGALTVWNVKSATVGAAKNKNNNKGRLEMMGRIPVHGFINGVAIGPRGRFCVAAVGQEHRLGRWERVPKAKNRLQIISLRMDNDKDDSDNDNDGEESGDSSDSDSGSSSSEED